MSAFLSIGVFVFLSNKKMKNNILYKKGQIHYNKHIRKGVLCYLVK